MNIQLNRVCLILAILALAIPFVNFIVIGDIPIVTGNTKGFLTYAGDYLSSQMFGVVFAVILFSISKMIERRY